MAVTTEQAATFQERTGPVAQSGRRSGFRWVVLGLIFVIYTVAAADRANIGIVLPFLQADFGLSNSQAGALASLFFLTYSLTQIPSAFLIQRFGTRRVLTLSVLVTSVCTACHALVNSIGALRVARVVLGVAEAPIGNACMTTINNWFPPKEKGMAAGTFMAAAKCGPVIAPMLGAWIIYHHGWHAVFLLFAIPGLVLPLLWYLLVPDRPAQSRFVNEAEAEYIEARETPAATRQSVPEARARSFPLLDRLIRARVFDPISKSTRIFSSWNIWGTALSYFLLVGTMNVILAWLPKYLTEVRGYAIMTVGFMAAAPFVGAVLGNIVGGTTSDRLLGGRRKPLMMFSCLATVVMMYSLRFSPNQAALLALMLFLTGFMLSLGFSLYPISVSPLTTRATFPLATSLVNTAGQLGGGAMPFVAGVMLDYGTWDLVFLTLAGTSVLAFLLLLTICEARPKLASEAS